MDLKNVLSPLDLHFVPLGWAGCGCNVPGLLDCPGQAGPGLSLKFKFTDLWAACASGECQWPGPGVCAGLGQLLSCQTDSSSHTALSLRDMSVAENSQDDMITSFSLHRDRMIELSLMSYINIKHWSSDLRIRTYRYYGIVGLFQNFRYHLLKGLMVYRINRIERSEKQFCGEHDSVSDLLVSTWQGPGVRTSVMWAELCWQGQCQESGH